jgi:hypothetical protein
MVANILVARIGISKTSAGLGMSCGKPQLLKILGGGPRLQLSDRVAKANRR